MGKLKKTKFVHEGQYAAEIEVSLIESDDAWAPHLSNEDAFRLDDAREALRQRDLEEAAKFGRVFELRPIIGA